jgi:hypothetical protein
VLRTTAAVVVAMLPRRYWERFEPTIPVSNCTFIASLLTLFAGAALGITGFMAHLEEVTSANNELYMEAARHVKGDEMPLPSALSGLSLFTFILLTPQGWISTYLTLSGLVRSIGSQFDDPHGDLLLTAADAGVRRVAGASAARAREKQRNRLEGPRVRDRVVAAADLNLPDADLVVIASRVKDGWDRGTVVLSDDGAFRIVGVEDRTIDGRLRRLYALARHTDLEAFRRTVPYAFPRIEGRP